MLGFNIWERFTDRFLEQKYENLPALVLPKQERWTKRFGTLQCCIGHHRDALKNFCTAQQQPAPWKKPLPEYDIKIIFPPNTASTNSSTFQQQTCCLDDNALLLAPPGNVIASLVECLDILQVHDGGGVVSSTNNSYSVVIMQYRSFESKLIGAAPPFCYSQSL
jgi:hypothetical protein